MSKNTPKKTEQKRNETGAGYGTPECTCGVLIDQKRCPRHRPVAKRKHHLTNDANLEPNLKTSQVGCRKMYCAPRSFDVIQDHAWLACLALVKKKKKKSPRSLRVSLFLGGRGYKQVSPPWMGQRLHSHLTMAKTVVDSLESRANSVKT